jgi:hypothetical protein
MRFFEYVFYRLLVIHLIVDENRQTVRLILFKKKGNSMVIEKSDNKNLDEYKNYKWPIILCVSGKNIIEKRVEKNDKLNNFERIENNPEFLVDDFVDSEYQYKAFVRQELLQEVLSIINKYNLSLYKIFLRKNITIITDSLFVNEFLKSVKCNSDLESINFACKVVNSKIKIGLLISYLIILIINYYVFNEKELKYSSLSEEVTAIKILSKNQTKNNVNSKEISELFILKNIDRPFTVIFDKIASLVPYDIRLTFLSFDPLKDPIKENKLIAVNDNIAEIRGYSKNTASIILFTEQIAKEGFVKHVNLVSMIKDKNKDYYQFSVNVYTTL